MNHLLSSRGAIPLLLVVVVGVHIVVMVWAISFLAISPATSNMPAVLVAQSVVRRRGCRSPRCVRTGDACNSSSPTAIGGEGVCCADLILALLRNLSKRLHARMIDHCVVSGTLLGAVRDGDIIPWTADADVFVERRFWPAVEQAINTDDSSHGLFFAPASSSWNVARVCASWTELHLQEFSHKQDDFVYIDIYDEHADLIPYLHHFARPLSLVTIRGESFSAPSLPDVWLEGEYGPYWREPDKHHNRAGDGVSFSRNPKTVERWSRAAVALWHLQARVRGTTNHSYLGIEGPLGINSLGLIADWRVGAVVLVNQRQAEVLDESSRSDIAHDSSGREVLAIAVAAHRNGSLERDCREEDSMGIPMSPWAADALAAATSPESLRNCTPTAANDTHFVLRLPARLGYGDYSGSDARAAECVLFSRPLNSRASLRGIDAGSVVVLFLFGVALL
eukprot:TRINITY_DN18251_c0_g1_i1.p1 TRINITY_DN18251_c0_g1~~TRINITY_DN18251_c0_g1_i1.p1  ORF type:complete len:450 (+),score=47.60 TRINITY_DN18251_c0_g1_i1:196-1545(+)